MEIPVYNNKAEEVGKIELSDRVFGLPLNKDLLYQVVTSQMANKRQVIAHAKGRSEVRGGGKKPWRQKGTGRARHGSIRSPIWKGGGVTFGPTKEKNFKKKINKKMLKKALGVALSSKVRDGRMIILDQLSITAPKTKEMAQILRGLSTLFESKLKNILLVTPVQNTDIVRSSRNLPYLDTVEARNLNPLNVISHRFVIMPKDSVESIERLFRRPAEPKADK